MNKEERRTEFYKAFNKFLKLFNLGDKITTQDISKAIKSFDNPKQYAYMFVYETLLDSSMYGYYNDIEQNKELIELLKQEKYNDVLDYTNKQEVNIKK